MKKYIYLLIVMTILGGSASYAQNKNSIDFLPEGYMLFDTIYGDLNKDGLEDCVLFIKGADEYAIVTNRFEEVVDRNRRGLIVLFQNKDSYDLVLENYTCFESENEDGGIYFPPELSLEINKGNLYLHYGHGRYGYWTYTFRYQNSDFELIGYDHTIGGVVIESEVSINFLSKKKLTSINTNENAEGGDEVYKETWTKIKIDKLVKLSEIDDFYDLDLSVY